MGEPKPSSDIEFENESNLIVANYLETEKDNLDNVFDLSTLQIHDAPFEQFLFKNDDNKSDCNDLSLDIFNKDNESLNSLFSPIIRGSVCIDSEIVNIENLRKTSFAEKFMNSPIYKSKTKPNELVNLTTFCNKLVSSSQKFNKKGNQLKKYIDFQDIESSVKETSKEIIDCNENQMKSLFSIFFYLNERSIILRMLDQTNFDKSNLEGFINEKYISPYNNFHFYVTFDEIVITDNCYEGIKYYRARNRFDSKFYSLKVSSYNEYEMQSFNRSSKSLHAEILILSRLQHSNIIRYFSSWIEYQSLYEQIEDCCDRSLEFAFHLFNKNNEIKHLTYKAARILVLQIGSALNYIHLQFKYVHNNVTRYSILVFPKDEYDFEKRNNWIFNSLFTVDSDFHVLFKLSCFEKSTPGQHRYFTKDVKDLTTVAAGAIGENPGIWKDKLIPQAMKMDNPDNDFVEILKTAVLGRVESAKDLIELVENIDFSEGFNGQLSV